VSDWGKPLADFIKALYWLVGALALIIAVLIAVIVYLVVK
jgi:hypothetical protein